MNICKVALNVDRILKERGIKQCAFAKKIGWTSAQVSHMMNGRKILDSDDIELLAKALDVTPNELFGWNKTA